MKKDRSTFEKASFIIPFQYHKKRYGDELLVACLESIPKNPKYEICVHETGIEPMFSGRENPNIKYTFTKTTEMFNRAWSLNYGVKHMSSGDMIVLLDNDLLLNDVWFQELAKCSSPSMAFKQMYYINKPKTEKFLKTRKLPSVTENTESKVPKKSYAAGGVTAIPRKIFYEVKGVPEDFRGTWGGPDNALMTKLDRLKYGPVAFTKAKVLHLYHDKTVPRVTKVQKKFIIMKRWKRKQWQKYVEKLGDNWGEDPNTPLMNLRKISA